MGVEGTSRELLAAMPIGVPADDPYILIRDQIRLEGASIL
jgi:hypothetical protein